MTEARSVPVSVAHERQLANIRKISSATLVGAPLRSVGSKLGFDFYDRAGKFSFTKFRAPGKKFHIEPSGQQLQLWNLAALRKGERKTLIITEGEIDALSWMEVGCSHVVSVPNGATDKYPGGDIVPDVDKQFSYLWDGDDLISELKGWQDILISVDNDKNGRALATELAIRLGRDVCTIIDYPPGCKDASDVLQQHGVEALLDLFSKRKPIVPSNLVSLMDIDVDDGENGVTTGWPRLDPNLRIARPELMIVTGAPNAGKSQWTWCLAFHLARLHDWRTAIIQFEDRPSRLRRSIEAYTQAEAYRLPEEDRAALRERMRDNVLAIRPENEIEIEPTSRTFTWLMETIERAGRRQGCKAVIIDPWNEIEHAWDRHENETQYTSRILSQLKRLARRLNMLIIVVAHPKGSSSKLAIEDMTLADVAGSMAWNTKADHGVIVARGEATNETYIRVSKSRDHETMGIPGIVRMQYNASTFSYTYLGSGI